jgi:hypothetical protein
VVSQQHAASVVVAVLLCVGQGVLRGGGAWHMLWTGIVQHMIEPTVGVGQRGGLVLQCRVMGSNHLRKGCTAPAGRKECLHSEGNAPATDPVVCMSVPAGARNYSQCDSMLIGDQAGANTYPYIQVC